MQKRLLLIFLLIITKSSFSQSSDSFFPLAVGNYWEYEWSDRLGLTTPKREHVEIISKVLKTNGKYYYVMVKKWYDQSNDSNIFYYRMDDSSNLYQYIDSKGKEYLSEKFSADSVASWVSCRFLHNYDYDSNDVYGHVGEIGYDKTLKTIEYSIGKIQSHNNWISNICFLLGVGIFYMSDVGENIVELTKYHIVSSTIDNNIKINDMSSSFKLLGNYPNPFNPTTNLKLILKNNSKVNITVYDIIGRKICSLFEGLLYNGEHIFTWNGKDDTYRDVLSGVYFYRFNIFDKNGVIIGSESKKMMLMR